MNGNYGLTKRLNKRLKLKLPGLRSRNTSVNLFPIPSLALLIADKVSASGQMAILKGLALVLPVKMLEGAVA